MTTQFCDRCYADITGKKSGRLLGIGDADETGDGNITDKADLCARCYRLLWAPLHENRKVRQKTK